MFFGSIDYALDIGCELSEDGVELLFARSSLVNASSAAGIQQIVGSVYLHIYNEQGLVNETQLSKKLGFTGKLIIHAKQISVVNNVFTIVKRKSYVQRKSLNYLKKLRVRVLLLLSIKTK